MARDGDLVAVLATVALPLETVYAFDRLFAVNGTNGLPITLDQGVVFSWVDRNVGPTGRVTVMKYPVGGPDWWAGQGYWWDVEFWNESAVDTMADMSLKKTPHWRDELRSAIRAPRSTRRAQFAFFHKTDVRFRLAGRQLVYDRDAYVFDTARPWRATWLTDGIYPDGWTRPHRPATITVFAEPGQKRPLQRFLTISVASPDPLEQRPVCITSNLGDWGGSIPPDTSVDRAVQVCVPPGGTGKVTVADARRVAGLPRPDEVRALGPRRPPGRRAPPLDRARRRARAGRSLPEREVGCTPHEGG